MNSEDKQTSILKSSEKTKSGSKITAAETLFDVANDDEEEKTAEDTHSKEVTFSEEAMTTPTKSNKRKSLVGLSPSQDAKVGMLKQMFQDHD